MKNIILSSIFIVLLLLPSTTLSETLHGKVVSVVDGDTITILNSQKKKIKIIFMTSR